MRLRLERRGPRPVRVAHRALCTGVGVLFAASGLGIGPTVESAAGDIGAGTPPTRAAGVASRPVPMVASRTVRSLSKATLRISGPRSAYVGDVHRVKVKVSGARSRTRLHIEVRYPSGQMGTPVEVALPRGSGAKTVAVRPAEPGRVRYRAFVTGVGSTTAMLAKQKVVRVDFERAWAPHELYYPIFGVFETTEDYWHPDWGSLVKDDLREDAEERYTTTSGAGTGDLAVAGRRSAARVVLRLAERVPASGLDPESWNTSLVVYNPAGFWESKIPIGRKQASDDRRWGAVPSDGDVVAVDVVVNGRDVVRGVDIDTGETRWESPGRLRGTPGEQAGHRDVLAVLEEGTQPRCAGDRLKVLDIYTGEQLYTYPLSYNGSCIGWDWYRSDGTGGDDWLEVRGVPYDAYTGARLTLPPIFRQLPLPEYYDRDAGYFARQFVADPRRGEIEVTDVHSGNRVYLLPADKARALGARLDVLDGGNLYIRTSDEYVRVDMTTGDAPAIVEPVRKVTDLVGHWTYYNDGSIVRDAFG